MQACRWNRIPTVRAAASASGSPIAAASAEASGTSGSSLGDLAPTLFLPFFLAGPALPDALAAAAFMASSLSSVRGAGTTMPLPVRAIPPSSTDGDDGRSVMSPWSVDTGSAAFFSPACRRSAVAGASSCDRASSCSLLRSCSKSAGCQHLAGAML